MSKRFEDETNCHQWIFILDSQSLVTVYTRFYPNNALLFSPVINFMLCHQFCLCGLLFSKNETFVKLTLRTAIILQWQWLKFHTNFLSFRATTIKRTSGVVLTPLLLQSFMLQFSRLPHYLERSGLLNEIEFHSAQFISEFYRLPKAFNYNV
jgi:hypothetical protein